LAKAGAVLVDLSSVLPATPRKLEARARARGLKFLEAPVSGGVTGARAATLAIMTGGDAPVLEQVRPVLSAMGKNIYHVGPAGSGNTIKAINNMMSTVNACAMMEGFAVGLKAGLDLMTMSDIVKASSGNSNALARVDRALIPRNFEPGFKVALMNKDLDTFHAIAKELHIPVSFSNMAQHYQQAALAAGLGEKDTSVIFTLIEQRAAIAGAKD
jgi:3-hydroxyisobutyrate dehydrogenase-like beta-hydroxyacid dehydrogenase